MGGISITFGHMLLQAERRTELMMEGLDHRFPGSRDLSWQNEAASKSPFRNDDLSFCEE